MGSANSRWVEPISMTRPAYITATSDTRPPTTARSWLTYTAATPYERAHAADRVEHVPLGRHVQAGGRLVQHDQRRPAGERHGQRDPLLLTAGQLVRVAAEHRRGGVERRLLQDLGDPLGRVADHAGVHPERLGQLGADPQGRVQRGGRVLRHVRHPCAAGPAQVAGAEPEQVRAVQTDLAGADPQAAAGVPEQGQGHRGLARAGLADQAEHLAGPDPEGHVADHLGAAALGADLEAGDLQADVTGRGRAGRAGLAVAGHAASRGPRSSSRAASSGRRSTPMATRAIASLYVFTPMVSRAISTAGAITGHGFTIR